MHKTPGVSLANQWMWYVKVPDQTFCQVLLKRPVCASFIFTISSSYTLTALQCVYKCNWSVSFTNEVHVEGQHVSKSDSSCPCRGFILKLLVESQNTHCDFFKKNPNKQIFPLSQPCRKDEECCDQQLCVWGQCSHNATRGEAGSTCQRQSDCSPDLCCAFHTGTVQRTPLRFAFKESTCSSTKEIGASCLCL